MLTIFRWVLLVKPNFLVEPCIVMINIKHATHYVVLKFCLIRTVQTNTSQVLFCHLFAYAHSLFTTCDCKWVTQEKRDGNIKSYGAL